MFTSQGTSSPFRSSGQPQFAPQSQQQQQPQQPQPFAQQGSAYSPFGASSSTSNQQQSQSNLNGQSMYGTPQYGMASSWGGAGSSNSPGAGPYGQFGAPQQQQQQQQQFNRGTPGGGTPGFADKPRQVYLPGYLSSGNIQVSSHLSAGSLVLALLTICTRTDGGFTTTELWR